MPLLRRHLSLIRDLTTVIEGLLIDNVQHDLRIHITTRRTSAGLGICIVRSFLEIGDSIDGITVEHGVASFIQQPQTVEELIDITGGLVDIHDDQLTLEGLLLQQVDHLLRVCR